MQYITHAFQLSTVCVGLQYKKNNTKKWILNRK